MEIYKRYGKIISLMGCRAFLRTLFEKGGMEPLDGDVKSVFNCSDHDFLIKQGAQVMFTKYLITDDDDGIRVGGFGYTEEKIKNI